MLGRILPLIHGEGTEEDAVKLRPLRVWLFSEQERGRAKTPENRGLQIEEQVRVLPLVELAR